MNRCLPIILISYLTNIYYEFLLNCLRKPSKSSALFFLRAVRLVTSYCA